LPRLTFPHPRPPTPDPSATRPSPTLDGTDLIGRIFNDPDLGLCRVVEAGPPHRLAPGEGNLDPIGPQLQAGWVPPCDTLRWVGPRTPPPLLKWQNGSKPCVRELSAVSRYSYVPCCVCMLVHIMHYILLVYLSI
jgi:hypothetical protein